MKLTPNADGSDTFTLVPDNDTDATILADFLSIPDKPNYATARKSRRVALYQLIRRGASFQVVDEPRADKSQKAELRPVRSKGEAHADV